MNNFKSNIYILIDYFINENGGTERQLLELIKNIDKDRFSLTIGIMLPLGYPSKRFTKDLSMLDVDIDLLNIEKIYSLKSIQRGHAFSRKLRSKKIDVLMTIHFSSDIWGTFWGNIAGVKKIISNRRDSGFWRNNNHIRAYRLVNRWVDKIVCNSREALNNLAVAEKPESSKMEIIHNGIQMPEPTDENAKQKLKTEFNLKAYDQVLACVGNFRPVKGHKFLIEALSILENRFPDLKLILVGKLDGAEENVELVKKLGLVSKIIFPGQRSDVSNILGISDVCALPSLSEGLSNTLMEYMAAKKPVVATTVGGNVELIKNDMNGLLVEEADSAALAEAIEKLLTDKKTSSRYIENSYKKIMDEFSIEHMVQSYASLFLAS